MCSVCRQDEEDQAYLMDDAGNIEPSQAPNQTRTPQSTACAEEEAPVEWGDEPDDQDFLKSLEDFEQNGEEISDQALLTCMTEFDS